MDQELVDLVYHAVIAPESWQAVLDEICRLFTSHSGVLAFSDNQTALSTLAVSHGVFEEQAVRDDYFSYFAAIDGAVPLYIAHPTGKVLAMSRVWSKRKLARDEFYNDFFAKLGLLDSAGVNVIRDERGTGLFTLQREMGAGNFTRGDVVALEALAPHLRRAMQLHRVFAPTRRAARAFLDGLEHVPFGVVAIDDRGRVWHMNQAAEAIVRRADGLTVTRGNGLSTADAPAAARIAQLIGGAVDGHTPAAGGQVQVARPDGKKPYGLLVAPMPIDPALAGDMGGRRGALVLISDPDRARRDDLQTALVRYRLTPSETKLLSALVEGESLQDYCDRAGISVNTGRFHLRALFAKTEARGQADLVRIVLLAMTGG